MMPAGMGKGSGLLQPYCSIGSAVSGGADSVCLLHILLELGFTPHVLHLNHGLRGEESRQDAEFVRALAAQLGLAVTIRDATLAPGNLEESARGARLDFFREMIASGTVDRVALGHTRNDQAETVLFRLLRGAGTAGLAGIRPVTADGIVRPLIEVDRAEVERYLRERHIAWREDSTNSGRQFARNRIRHDLLPQLARDWNPAIVETLAHTASFAAAEEEYWNGEIERFPLTAKHGGILAAADSLAGLPVALGRRVVRRAIELAKGDLRQVDFRHVERILELAAPSRGHGRVQIPGLDVVRSFNWVRFGGLAPSPYSIPVTIPGFLPIPGSDCSLSLELIEKTETSGLSHYVYNIEMGCLDWPRLSGSLEIRNWRPGDRYRPCDVARSQKLKTLFQQARIPLWERRGWPVLVDGTGIVWARRFGPAADLVSTAGSGTILRIREVETGFNSGIGSGRAASKE